MGAELRRTHALTRYREAAPQKVKDVVARYGAKLDDMATARAPRKSGTLKRSIGHEIRDGGWSVAVGVRNGLPYARIQDLGGQTSNAYGPNSGYIAGNRYLTGSWQEIGPDFYRAVAEALRP